MEQMADSVPDRRQDRKGEEVQEPEQGRQRQAVKVTQHGKCGAWKQEGVGAIEEGGDASLIFEEVGSPSVIFDFQMPNFRRIRQLRQMTTLRRSLRGWARPERFGLVCRNQGTLSEPVWQRQTAQVRLRSRSH